MMTGKDRKVALVTGASYGVGRAVAIGLARAGYDLVMVARSGEELEKTADRVRAAGARGLVQAADLSDPSAVADLGKMVVNTFPKLHAVISCAFGHIGEDQGLSILDVSPHELKEFLMASVLGNWLVTREFAPMLRESEGRAIFLVADWGFPQHNVFLTTHSAARDRLGSEAYVSAKYAITGLANSLERMTGVGTVGIYPGIIASLKSSSATTGALEYFDLDDPDSAVDQEEAYAGGWAIPLRDIVETVKFSLNSYSIPRSIILKPRATEYDGLHV